MEDAVQERTVYTTPRWVQVWFLRRSRDKWKKKAQARKEELKRRRSQAAYARKSRQKWREEATHLRQQVKNLREEMATLKNQSVAEKKDGLGAPAGSRR